MSLVAILVGTEANGVCVLVMCHCLFRTTEPVNLFVGDCSFEDTLETCVLTLRNTKTSERSSGTESVIADNFTLVGRLW